ncbi:MAG: hypothetical protein JW703_00190, partial [Candidatus Diapherotrites archaeon]|nr:hypothetical protein [Candidatus Diapherotrites archaeon]
MDESKKQRLIDSVKRLKEAGNSKEEVLNGLKDIGLKEQEITEIEKIVFNNSPESLKNPVKISSEEKPESIPFEPEQKIITKTIPLKEKKSFFGNFLKPKKKEQKIKLNEKKIETKPTADKTINQGIGFVSVKPLAFREVLPVRVSDFDKLIQRGGLKRGDTILLSGGCGTGKTTFGMQSLYNGALNGEKGVYITLEESTEKIRENMVENFGWDLTTLERKGLIALISVDPLKLARSVEALLVQKRGGLYIEDKQFDLSAQFNIPFKPDRVVFDSISALSIAFLENESGFRQYLRSLFSTFESYGSLNFILGETEQMPGVYSRSGIEEFLADGVIVLYNLKIHNTRQKALEILKIRSSNHEKKIVPYK